MDQSTERKGIKRRTLVAGTAWAVPAVTIAAPAMAYQQSGGLVTATGKAAKLQGNSCCGGWKGPGPCPYYTQGYRYYFDVNNPPGKDACIVITGVTVGGVSVSTYQVWLDDNTIAPGCCSQTPGSHSFFLAAADSMQIAIDLDFDNSANSTVRITYDVRNATDPDGAGPLPAPCTVDFAAQKTDVAVGTPPTTGDCVPFA